MKHCVTMAIAGLLLAGCGGQGEQKRRPFSIHTGEIGRAKYCIAVGRQWNRQVLLLAHGLRPMDMPLTAEFAVDRPFYRRLLSEGWIIASTSYSRNGMIVRGAAEDIDVLRQHVEHSYGKPKRVFVIGWSMGGAVATLIAETDKQHYDGVLAIGAALSSRDPTDPYKLTYRPIIPILFLNNQNEQAGPRQYLASARGAEDIPILWHVRRDGHCNVSDAEQAAALDALFKYAATGLVVPDKDATIPLDKQRSTAVFKDGGAYTRIAEVSSSFGNLYTELIEADLISLGIEPGGFFLVRFKNSSFRAYYGTTYSDVPRGRWVGFLTAEGNLKVARNLENAAETLGCKEGDTIFIGQCDQS